MKESSRDEAKAPDSSELELSTVKISTPEYVFQKDFRPVPTWKLFSLSDPTEILLMFVGTLGTMGTGISFPLFFIIFGQTLNKLNSGSANMTDQINKLSILFVELAIMNLIMGTLQVFCWSLAGERQSQKLKELYVRAILRQDIGWFDLNSPSELSTRVNMAIFEIQDGIGRKLGDSLQFFNQFVASFVVAFASNWKLTLVLIAAFPCIAGSASFLTWAVASADKKGSEQYARAGSVASEVLSGIRTVVSLGGEKKEIGRYGSFLNEAETVGILKRLRMGVGTGLMFGTALLTYALGIWYGIKLIADDVSRGCMHDCASGGSIITAFFGVIIGSVGLGQITPGITALTTAKSAAGRVFATIERVPSIDTLSKEGIKLDSPQGRIDVENVYFCYPSRLNNQVCNGYNLSIKAGEKVALVGPSGSGKSTLMNLVLRFYDPKSGVVKFDGHDLRSLNVQWYREQIGYVKQEPLLFAGTIRDNIEHGKKGASDQQIRAAAAAANADRFISAFPGGYNTEVGEAGVQLSGGQKQRIAIARAVLRNPAILLLDEATSALDNESERLVQKALDDLQLKSSWTTIVIAHRLSTTKKCDRIAVIDGGKVVECGPHSALLEQKGLYHKLYTMNEHEKPELPEVDDKMIDQIIEREVSLSRAVVPAERSVSIASHISVAQRVSIALEALSRTHSMIFENVTDVESPSPSLPEVPISRITAIMKEDFGYVALGLLGGLIAGGVYPAWGAVMANALGTFYLSDPSDMRSHSVRLAEIFVGLAGAIIIGNILLFYGLGSAGEKLTRKLRARAFTAIVRHDIGWFDSEENSPGRLTTHLQEDCKKVSAVTGDQWGVQVQTLSTLIVALALGLSFSWRIGLVVIATLPLNAAAGAIYMKAINGTLSDTEKQGPTVAGSILAMAVNGMRTVAAFNLQDFLSESYNNAGRSAGHGRMRRSFFSGLSFAASQCLIFLTWALLFWYAAKLMASGKNTFTEVMASMMAIMYAAFGLGQASATAGDQKSALESTKKLFHTIDTAETLAIDSFSEQGEVLGVGVEGKLQFKGLFFSYPSRPDVQIYGGPSFPEGYNLTIQAGQTVAFVGPSGSGKSTIMSLLLRFYSPQKGEIFLDGKDIRTLNLKSYRSQFGYVGQEPVLFSGTIRNNIAYANPTISDEEVAQAARVANAHEFIEKFPLQYETDVGEQSALLSGGQKQRIAIARAIICDPPILLLDEATSALDNESEKVVQNALDKLQSLKKRTTLVIAHRLSTIRNSDQIAVINKGGVSELGTHDKLIALGGIYAELDRMSN